MANVDRPLGLVPIRTLSGAPMNGMLRSYLFQDSNAVFLGDPVKSSGTAGAAGVFVNGQNCEGMAGADRAAAGDRLLGVVVGFTPLQSDLTVLHKAADATDRIGYVVVDPSVVYEVQVTTGTTFAVTSIGLHSDMITWAAGSTTTGQSIVELSGTTETTTTAAQFKILGMVQRPDNAIGEHVKVEVVINEHEFLDMGATGV